MNTRVIEIGSIGVEPDFMIECCNNCGSAGVIHFDENDGDENAFHRCMRCMVDYIGCNWGPFINDPRKRLSGEVEHRRSR